MKKQIICTAAMSLLSGLGILGTTGCESMKSPFAKHEDERSEGRSLDDKHITEAVKKNLEEEPVYKFTDVDVRAYGGDVQLSGFVNSDDQRRRAGQIAATTPGVMRVHNSIALKPFVPTPTGATNASQSRIYANPPGRDNIQPAPQSTDQK